ncbi:putative N-chimaerin [Trichinella spiralis]|uniref:putative N-chimaerin n=1 Tax=Trichinella spiralis TaxID=6334 RepID=UPI0001EFB4BB|nr:putative N-chimaerin [Trichinella spiralis]
MTNGHHAVILWLEYVDVILSKLSTPPLACFPFRRKPGCHYAWYLVPKHSCSFLGAPLPCRVPLASLGSSREFHLMAFQCIFAYTMRSFTLNNRLPKTYCHTLPNLKSDRCFITFNTDKTAVEDLSWGQRDPVDFAYT